MASHRHLSELVHEGLLALQDAGSRMHLHRAWKLLQDHDADGDEIGPLPYTAPALAELELARARDSEDIGIVHHLAIAHHARAWDLELAGDPRAAGEWERALGYWRTISASSEFWADLQQKFAECDSEAQESPVPDLRRNMLENLLDVHVDFVRRYSENESYDRANLHIEIVRRATIPPATKRRLVAKLFDAMTASVPDAKAARDFDSALTLIERFLALFPDHVPALRMHAEISRELAASLSFKDQWPQIVGAADRAEPFATTLAAHPARDEDPLASSAFQDLAFTVACRANDRGGAHFAGEQWEEARTAIDLGIRWGRLALPYAPAESALRNVLAGMLLGRAACLHAEFMQLANDEGVEPRIVIRLAMKRLRDGISDLEEAVRARATDSALIAAVESRIDAFREELAELEAASGSADLL